MLIMRKLVFGTACLWAGANLIAAEPQWLTSLPDAEALAKNENRLVLLDFTGSDWCVPCQKLKEEVLSKQPFLQYAASNLVLVEVDFPLKKLPKALSDANDALQDKYKVEGYPTLLLVKPDGTALTNHIGILDSPGLQAFLDAGRNMAAMPGK
jgi:thiol:disulfide interchange protein